MGTTLSTLHGIRLRAEILGDMAQPDEGAYWDITESLFQFERLLEYQKPRFYWSKKIKREIDNLKDILFATWIKINSLQVAE